MKKALILLFFAIAGLIGGSAIHIWKQWDRPSSNQSPVVVLVPSGSGPKAVGRILEEKGLVPSSRIFVLYCRFTGLGGQLKAGGYWVQPGMSTRAIVEMIAAGRSAATTVTIPEGRASWEVYSILHAAFPLLDSARWDSLVHSREFAQKLDVPAANLEGWLFPDTYNLPIDAKEEDILKLLVRSLQKKIVQFDTTTPHFQVFGNWQRVLTFASIVEEETGRADERAHVSSVFHNRLRLGMPLGADPTVRFIFRNLTGPIYKSQLQSASPYNTRRFAGLPPGPISNPGLKAIQASLNPLSTQDLYFVAKDDGSGEHFFAPSLDQHNRYKAIAARNRAAQP